MPGSGKQKRSEMRASRWRTSDETCVVPLMHNSLSWRLEMVLPAGRPFLEKVVLDVWGEVRWQTVPPQPLCGLLSSDRFTVLISPPPPPPQNPTWSNYPCSACATLEICFDFARKHFLDWDCLSNPIPPHWSFYIQISAVWRALTHAAHRAQELFTCSYIETAVFTLLAHLSSTPLKTRATSNHWAWVELLKWNETLELVRLKPEGTPE